MTTITKISSSTNNTTNNKTNRKNNEATMTAITTARSTADSARSIPAALRSEWIKVTSLRSYGLIAGLTGLISGLAAWALARFVTDVPFTTAELYTITSIFTAVFAAVAGILMFSSEAQHGTLAGMLTAQPSKTVITVGKAIAASAYGAFLAAVGMTAAIAGSQIGGVAFGDTSTMVSDGALAILFTAIASVLGLGIGMITRHSAAAISGLLAWWLLAETILSSFISQSYSRFLPFSAGNALVGVTSGPENVSEGLFLTATEGGLVFAGYALAAVVIGAIALKKVETN